MIKSFCKFEKTASDAGLLVRTNTFCFCLSSHRYGLSLNKEDSCMGYDVRQAQMYN